MDDYEKEAIAKIAHQQRVAEEIYSSVKLLDRGAVLAGGAPRNWSLDLPAKDLDFFIQPGFGLPREDFLEILSRLIGEEIVSITPKESGYPNETFECKKDGETIQLILTNVGSDFTIAAFSCTMSMVYWDFANKVSVDISGRSKDDPNHYIAVPEDDPLENEYYYRMITYFPAQKFVVQKGKHLDHKFGKNRTWDVAVGRFLNELRPNGWVPIGWDVAREAVVRG